MFFEILQSFSMCTKASGESSKKIKERKSLLSFMFFGV